MKGYLECIFSYLINYLSFIKTLFDIVSRAVKADKQKNMPAARTNKGNEYRGTKFFVAIIKAQLRTVAIIFKKPSSAVLFCACKIFEGGDYYD